MQLPAPGAIIVGIIIVLRSDGEGAYGIILDRLIAAFMGGVMALAVWEIIWIAPSLPVLAASLLLAAWLFAMRIAEGGPGAGLAMKSLSVLAILIGEGFSIFYEDADDRFGTRLAGVMIGLGYVALVDSHSTTPDRTRWRQHECRLTWTPPTSRPFLSWRARLSGADIVFDHLADATRALRDKRRETGQHETAGIVQRLHCGSQPALWRRAEPREG